MPVPLPIPKASRHKADKHSNLAQRGEITKTYNSKFNDIETLVCDEDDIILKVLSHVLREMGFGFIKITCNLETVLMLIHKAADKPFDFTICDWKMPEVLGVE